MGRYARILIITAAVCGAVVAHWRSLGAAALSFDDQQYLTDNALVQNPGLASAKRFLTEVLAPSTVAGYYQPLAMISLMGDYAAGGRENNLRPFHITSLAFHTANTALIIVLLYMLFGNIWAAAAAGLLFGVHPMTVEPIPWVGERKTLLAAFFALWSLILYVRYSRGGGWKSFIGCFVMYLLALMSKPTSVPLPAVMLLMDYWPLERIRGWRTEDRGQKTEGSSAIWLISEKLPLFALAGVFAAITYISQHSTGGTVAPTKYGPWHIPLVLSHNIIFYLSKMILPVNLSSHYAFPKPFDLSNTTVLGGIVRTCILVPILFISLRWTRAALTGWLIFFVAIFPTMGVVGFTNVIASDKYAYLPAVGILMTVTAFLTWLGENKKNRTAAVVVVLILASAEALATGRYLVYWQDSIMLINHMLTLAPDSAFLYDNRGSAYYDRSELDLAICDYNKALQINQRYYEAYYNRGNIYKNKGEYDLAISDYTNALRINPRFVKAYNNRGNVYKNKGLHQLAVSDYNKALDINPKSAETYNNRGNAYRDQGRLNLAISDYNKALEINRWLVESYFNKAIACERTGRKKQAIEAYKTFIRYAAPACYAPQIEGARQRIRELER